MKTNTLSFKKKAICHSNKYTSKICLTLLALCFTNTLSATKQPSSYGFTFLQDSYNAPENEWRINDISNVSFLNGGGKGYVELTSLGSITALNYNDSYFAPTENYVMKFRVSAQEMNSNGYALRVLLNNGSRRLHFLMEDDGIYVQNSSNQSVLVFPAPTSSTWYNFTLSVNDSEVTCYLNGIASNAGVITLPKATKVSMQLATKTNSKSNAQRVHIDSLFIYSQFESLLIDKANNGAVTHSLDFGGGLEFGITSSGGGYGSSLKMGSGKPEVLIPGFGAGWNNALRSKMHENMYNPTQAGCSAHEGSETTIDVLENGKRLSISSLTTPLFVLDSRHHDWIENEPWVNTDGSYFYDFNNNDGVNSDIDGHDEFGLLMDDEIASEMNFNGYWEDVTTGSTPIMKHFARWAYERNPCAILQFNQGSGGIDEGYRVTDISPTEYIGNQQASDNDISFLLSSYNYRLNYSKGYNWVMWKQGGVWQSQQIDSDWLRIGVFGTNNDANNTENLGPDGPKQSNLSKQADDQILIIAKSNNPNAADAVGFYFPYDSPINSNATRGYDRSTGQAVFSEDRSINAYFEVSLRNRNWSTVFLRQWSLGLSAPGSLDKDRYEALIFEGYHLFGTPNEIYSAALDL